MASVRGVAVLNAIRYVRESFGPNPHQAVVKALSEPHRATFLGPIREASWKPVEDLIAYLETAQRLLAPADPLFFRRVGRFSGQLERASQGFEVMVADPSTAMRMGPVVWRSFFDAGRLEVEILGPREGMARVFEAQLNVNLYIAQGLAIAETTAMAEEGGVLSPFSVEVPFVANFSQPACLWVFQRSGADGRPVDVVQIPLQLNP